MRLTTILLLVGVLAGCKSADGVYLPGCAAYAGDRLELRNGEFEWDKFTDMVRLDESGGTIDPFPGYPRVGTYEVDRQTVTMRMADDNTIETFHLHRNDGRLLLLTQAQQADWKSSGRYDSCTLTLTTDQ